MSDFFVLPSQKDKLSLFASSTHALLSERRLARQRGGDSYLFPHCVAVCVLLCNLLYFSCYLQGGAAAAGGEGEENAVGRRDGWKLLVGQFVIPSLPRQFSIRDSSPSSSQRAATTIGRQTAEPVLTSVFYPQSPADWGLNIPPAALNTASCLPLYFWQLLRAKHARRHMPRVCTYPSRRADKQWNR